MNEIFESIRRVIDWLPIIWADQDWHYTYLMDLLKFKFELMAKYFEKNKLATEVQQVRECAAACARIANDNYGTDMLIEFTEKWGESDFVWVPERGTAEIRYLKALTPGEQQQAQDECAKIFVAANKMLNNDVAFLCDTMKAGLLRWWD